MLFKEATVLASVALAASQGFKLEARDGVAHGAHGHDHGHHAPAAPAVHHHHEPAVSASAYAPAPVAATGYEEPSSYGVPSYASEPALPDLTPIIIGILVLTGLSLLFPTYVSLTNVRRKRDADEETSPMTEVFERVNDIYMSVVESEECMERIACEVGGLANDFGLGDKSVMKMVDPFVSGKYKQYYKQFTNGQNCHKIKCGTFSF